MELALLGRLLAACLVIALVLGGVHVVAQRLGRPQRAGGVGGRLVALVETTYLPGSASLHVVRIADRYYVVGRNAAALATLCELERGEVDRWNAAHASRAGPVEPIRRLAKRLRGQP